MKKIKNINIFICSTYTDLKDYRSAVIEKLRANKGIINAQEFFGARNSKPLDTCLEEVGKSEVFIMILGARYGSLSKDGKSFVEHEYDKAVELGIIRLAYILDEEYIGIPLKSVETGSGAKKLTDFKEKVKKDLIVETFTSPDDLSEKVLRDLYKTLPKEGFSIDKRKADESLNRDLAGDLYKFINLPKVNYGQEFELKVELHGLTPANQEECRALSLHEGATIKRKITPQGISGEVESLLRELGNDVYASYELAQELLEIQAGEITKLRLKTIQGTLRKKLPIYGHRFSFSTSAISDGMVVVDYEPQDIMYKGLQVVEIIAK